MKEPENVEGNKDHHNENENGADDLDGATPAKYPYKKTNLGGGADVSLSLLSLLDVMSCPRVAEAEIECLAQTEAQRYELRALRDLWQSLGRPTSVFWRETRVFYNRIVDAYGVRCLTSKAEPQPLSKKDSASQASLAKTSDSAVGSSAGLDR